MTVPILVPYRPDGGHRDQLWSHLKDHYWSRWTDNDLYVVEGKSWNWVSKPGSDYCPHSDAMGTHRCANGPFNRSAAINDAARRVEWQLAVIADADTWVPRKQLEDAWELASRTGRLVAAFTSVVELSESCTRALLADPSTSLMDVLDVERVRTEPLTTQSSMLVVPRLLWDRIGGFDERFVGWGGEDNAFWKAATVIGGEPLRIDGSAFHLWHPVTDPVEKAMSLQWRANWARWTRYRDEVTCECSLRKVQRG